jgi:raffinose/stachyose/melibiose transport system permease protein
MDLETVYKEADSAMNMESVLSRILELLLTLLMIAVLVVSFYPLLWMFLNSFKSNTEIFQKPLSLPAKWNVDVFGTAWVRLKLASAVGNSMIITGSVTVLNVIISGMAAYSTSHLKYKGQFLFLSFCIGCQVVSGQVLLVPLYKLMNDLSIINTRIGLILAITAFSLPLSIYLFYGFFRGIPREIYESTRIDGCGNWRYFLVILVPLSTPIIASVGIFQALFTWNEYLFTLTFLRNMSKWTIQPALKNIFAAYSQQYNVNFAALSIVVVPILVFYVFLQKYFIRGLTAGSVKG